MELIKVHEAADTIISKFDHTLLILYQVKQGVEALKESNELSEHRKKRYEEVKEHIPKENSERVKGVKKELEKHQKELDAKNKKLAEELKNIPSDLEEKLDSIDFNKKGSLENVAEIDKIIDPIYAAVVEVYDIFRKIQKTESSLSKTYKESIIAGKNAQIDADIKNLEGLLKDAPKEGKEELQSMIDLMKTTKTFVNDNEIESALEKFADLAMGLEELSSSMILSIKKQKYIEVFSPKEILARIVAGYANFNLTEASTSGDFSIFDGALDLEEDEKFLSSYKLNGEPVFKPIIDRFKRAQEMLRNGMSQEDIREELNEETHESSTWTIKGEIPIEEEIKP